MPSIIEDNPKFITKCKDIATYGNESNKPQVHLPLKTRLPKV